MVGPLEAENQYLAWHTYSDHGFDSLKAWNVQFSDFHISTDLDRRRFLKLFYAKITNINKPTMVDRLEAENQ